MNHINIENDEATIPYYADHKDGLIAGFFGCFSFLSNFYALENGVTIDELTYPSVECAYQAYKYAPNQRLKFIDISASEAKKLGELAPNFDAKKWNKNKVELMRVLVYQKFEKNIKLRKMLLTTDGYLLEERNSWGDCEWGTNELGIGKNNLGIILMNVRDKFIAMERKDEF
jgi:ribA/ribD-fused uncharacterized protein